MPFGQIVQHVSPTLNTGKLRQKISLVRVQQIQDAAGGQDVSNVVIVANVHATIEAITGTEQWAAQQFASSVTHYVIIRYIGAAPSWLAGTAYLQNAVVKDTNGNLQQAQAAGTSGTTAPTWNATQGQITNDSGALTWKNIGAAPSRTCVTANLQVLYNGRLFQILDVFNPDERNKMLVLLCAEINDSATEAPNPSAAIG